MNRGTALCCSLLSHGIPDADSWWFWVAAECVLRRGIILTLVSPVRWWRVWLFHVSSSTSIGGRIIWHQQPRIQSVAIYRSTSKLRWWLHSQIQGHNSSITCFKNKTTHLYKQKQVCEEYTAYSEKKVDSTENIKQGDIKYAFQILH